MTIWKREFSLAELNQTSKNTLMQHLQIEYVDFDDNSLTAQMPVAEFTHQPLGMLHGGASVALAESVGSLAANMAVPEGEFCVGLDINANHIKAKRNGHVLAKASPIHIGKSTQVWQIDIKDEKDVLLCVSRLTVAVRA